MSRNASKVMREPVARAIDAGFGVTKFSRAARTEGENKPGPIVFEGFDSLASATGKTQVTINGARTRDTVFVKFQAREYEVDKDIRQVMVGGNFDQELNSSRESYLDLGDFQHLGRISVS